jgi:hypothetical protein
MGLNEPQAWTLIGVFGTAMFGLVALVLTSIRGQFTSMRAEMGAELRSLRSDLSSEMRSGFTVLGSRMDHLDRDVQLLMNREFGENRG